MKTTSRAITSKKIGIIQIIIVQKHHMFWLNHLPSKSSRASQWSAAYGRQHIDAICWKDNYLKRMSKELMKLRRFIQSVSLERHPTNKIRTGALHCHKKSCFVELRPRTSK